MITRKVRFTVCCAHGPASSAKLFEKAKHYKKQLASNNTNAVFLEADILPFFSPAFSFFKANFCLLRGNAFFF